MDDDLTVPTDYTDHPVTTDDPFTDIDCIALAQRFPGHRPTGTDRAGRIRQRLCRSAVTAAATTTATPTRRQRVWVAVGVVGWLTALAAAMVVSLTTVGYLPDQSAAPAMTRQQAVAIANLYTRDAVAQLPGAQIDDGYPTSVDCDDNPGGPAGLIDYSDMHTIIGVHAFTNAEAFDILYTYWTGLGYVVRSDHRNAASMPTLDVADLRDSFWISLVESIDGALTLMVSAPCFRPLAPP
jgi:hypothetical protein